MVQNCLHQKECPLPYDVFTTVELFNLKSSASYSQNWTFFNAFVIQSLVISGMVSIVVFFRYDPKLFSAGIQYFA